VLTAELAGKAAYGWLIGLASGGIYALEAEQTNVTAADGRRIALPRYAAFTPAALALLRGGTDLSAIAGNDEIVVAVLAPLSWQNPRAVFAQPLLIAPGRQRVLLVAPVTRLWALVQEIDAAGAILEHFYDY